MILVIQAALVILNVVCCVGRVEINPNIKRNKKNYKKKNKKNDQKPTKKKIKKDNK